jgi:hypothetical protein
MGWFGWRAKDAIPDKPVLSGPDAILADLAVRVPQYIADADQGRVVYPAGKRSVSKPDDVRAIWDHSRLEAMRYVMALPRREFELLADPARQSEMLDAFLRQQPHEDTVIDFTGATMSDVAIAVFAGFNWLSQCAIGAGVDRDRFSGTLYHFRKLAVLAQQWWAMEGADARCRDMLATGEKPPLMLYLIWTDYTRLAREIAAAALGRAINDAAPANADALTQTMVHLQRAEDPADLAA